jgi:hypothetical protein
MRPGTVNPPGRAESGPGGTGARRGVAVAGGSVRAYSNGFEFTAHVRLRRDR